MSMALNNGLSLDFTALGAIKNEPTKKPEPGAIKKVVPFVFLSDAESAENEEELKRHGIDVIICLSVRSGCRKFKSKFEYLVYDMKDDVKVDILPQLTEITKIVDSMVRQKRNVLVHCRKGRSRAPIVIMAYLMKYHQKQLEEAFSLLRSCDNAVDPNISFLLQIKRFSDQAV